MARHVAALAPRDGYFFSSIDIDALHCLRRMDESAYLGVIVAPEPDNSIAEIRKHLGEQGYAVFRAQIRARIGDPEELYAIAGNRNLLTQEGIASIAKLGNVGIHIDAATLARSPNTFRLAQKAHLQVQTYFQGTDESHVDTLSELYKSTGQRPDSLIINGDWKAACQRLKQKGLTF